MKGLIFSIEEFALFDGDGIRVNVFFKGCPLNCLWCHNPEGQNGQIEIVRNPNSCRNCGKCFEVCRHPEKCELCDNCIINCPADALRRSGKYIDSDDLSRKLLQFEGILKDNGGLTFSGGEVLMQPDFLLEVLQKTASMHRIIETSGFGDSQKFEEILKNVDFVFYDLKIMDSEKHKRYTGVSNELILKNAKTLIGSGVPFTIRLPFIKEVNTDRENLVSLCEFLKNAENLKNVELLQYNKLAGAKYKLMGREYDDCFKEADEQDYLLAKEIFKSFNLEDKLIIPNTKEQSL